MKTTHSMPVTKPEDMVQSRISTGCFFTDPGALPISFVFDGRTIAGIPQDWRPISNRRRIDANIIETVFAGDDPETGLHVRVEYAEYLDYPVVEWIAWFTNKGHETTPLISDILAMDGDAIYSWENPETGEDQKGSPSGRDSVPSAVPPLEKRRV